MDDGTATTGGSAGDPGRRRRLAWWIGGGVALVVVWDRDRAALQRLRYVPGWGLAALLALVWPLTTVKA